MPPLSGSGPSALASPRTSVGSPTVGRSMPTRLSRTDSDPVDQLTSTPDSRSAGQNGITTDVITLGGSATAVVGASKDTSNTAVRAAAFTKANSTTSAGETQLTEAETQKNLDAVAARKAGVMGCIGKGSGSSSPTPGCNASPCDSVDCLTKLLTGNLLDLDAKKLLCDAANATERALKRQIDSTGDSLLAAANNLTSAQALVAPLSTLSNFVNKIDAGAVANCFGAQALKDKVNGQLKKATNTIKAAEKGVHDKIAEKFNKATTGLQQFSITPNLCANKSPVSLASAF